MLRAALFDLDDTLYDREAAIRRFAEAQHRRYELPMSADLFVEEFVMLDAHGRVWKDVVYEELRQRHRLSPTVGELLADYVDGFADYCIPFPGLRTALADLKHSGLKLGLITNGRSGFQQRTLRSLTVADLFDTVIVSEEVGMKKPDPRIFHLALSHLETSTDEAVMLGDDLTADVEGAAAIGVRAIRAGPNTPAQWPANWRDLISSLFDGE